MTVLPFTHGQQYIYGYRPSYSLILTAIFNHVSIIIIIIIISIIYSHPPFITVAVLSLYSNSVFPATIRLMLLFNSPYNPNRHPPLLHYRRCLVLVPTVNYRRFALTYTSGYHPPYSFILTTIFNPNRHPPFLHYRRC